MQVIQDGQHRWYRQTYVARSVVHPSLYILYGIGISGNPIQIHSYSTRRAANFYRVIHAAHYHRAMRGYRKDHAS